MEHETAIRLGAFFGIFAVMAVWELLTPRKVLTTSKAVRWLNNLSITFLNAVLLRLIFPLMAIETALVSSERGWGIFNAMAVPELMKGILCVILLEWRSFYQWALKCLQS